MSPLEFIVAHSDLMVLRRCLRILLHGLKRISEENVSPLESVVPYSDLLMLRNTISQVPKGYQNDIFLSLNSTGSYSDLVILF